jgi:carbamoyltransferase
MTAILGISAYYHDSAAAIVVDGEVIAAAQEERFSRKKHDADFPRRAVEYCLGEACVRPEDLAWVAFYDKPFLKFERLLETYLAFAPAGFLSFRQAMPLWLKTKLFLPRRMRDALGGNYRRRFVFPSHHESHAASAFFPSPFEEAAILTVDGVGEWATASIGTGRGHEITLRSETKFPHSLGLLYSAFTHFTGFKINSGEYKLMGLAPYGEPKYAKTILDHLVRLYDDGSIWLDQTYFGYCQGLIMTNRKFERLFDGPARKAESKITQREMDIAASIQAVTEEAYLRMARHVHRETGHSKLCLAGGVALNCVANGRLLRESPFDELWIQPAAGDAGGALGAALFVHHQLLGKPRTIGVSDSQRGSFLGPAYTDREIGRFLDSAEADYRRLDDPEALCESVAQALADQKIVGWFQGRMEFGPRALGARSILGDPRSPRMQSVMNLKIKFRESFRPFAPAVLRDHVADWFDLDADSPYMLLVANVKPEHRIPTDPSRGDLWGIERLNQPRSTIPAVTHVDHSARIQTVDADRNPLFYRLISAFHRKTGCPLVVNTSFNVRGEPIVGSPSDAYRCFRATDIDVLAIGSYLVEKSPSSAISDREREAHLAQFQLD